MNWIHEEGHCDDATRDKDVVAYAEMLYDERDRAMILSLATVDLERHHLIRADRQLPAPLRLGEVPGPQGAVARRPPPH